MTEFAEMRWMGKFAMRSPVERVCHAKRVLREGRGVSDIDRFPVEEISWDAKPGRRKAMCRRWNGDLIGRRRSVITEARQ